MDYCISLECVTRLQVIHAKTTPANSRDNHVVLPPLPDMPRIAGPKGRPRTKSKALQGDAGYRSIDLATLVKWLGINRPQPNKHRETVSLTRGAAFADHSSDQGKQRVI